MIDPERWDVCEAYVPFEEINGEKKRPVVVLDSDTLFVVFLKMTSHSPRYKTLVGEYELVKWQEAGLQKPTVVQCRKLFRLEKSKFTGITYGKLASVDITGLQAMLKYMQLNG